MMLVRAFVADAEVQLLHALDLVADVLELADVAVGGETLHDVAEGAGDGVRLLCVLVQLLVINGRIGHEDNGRIDDVAILLVLGDVALTDGAEVYTLLDRSLADTDLLTVAFGGHTNNVTFGIDMILAELNVLECTVDLVVVAFDIADTEQNDTGKSCVLLDLLEVGTVENDLILINKVGACGDAVVVGGAETESAKLIRSLTLKDKLGGAYVGPRFRDVISPAFGLALALRELLKRRFNKRIVNFHDVSPLTQLYFLCPLYNHYSQKRVAHATRF